MKWKYFSFQYGYINFFFMDVIDLISGSNWRGCKNNKRYNISESFVQVGNVVISYCNM